jgi:hypothetical protein
MEYCEIDGCCHLIPNHLSTNWLCMQKFMKVALLHCLENIHSTFLQTAKRHFNSLKRGYLDVLFSVTPKNVFIRLISFHLLTWEHLLVLLILLLLLAFC